MPRGGDQPISNFESDLKLPSGFTARVYGVPDELSDEADAAIEWMRDSRPAAQSFWPALGLAFVAQVEHALGLLGRDHEDDILAGSRVKTVRADGSPVRQLELDLGPDLDSVPTRRFYNAADTVIRVEMRRQHPSTPGHATSGWRAYEAFVRLLGRCSPAGRTRIATWLWEQGVLPLPQTVHAGTRTRQARVFLEVVKSLDTSSGRTGGALYQAMVYAYLVADSPSLNFQSHKVNVGSSRAGAIGDVDGFLGDEIVLAAEAKDKDLTMADEDDLEAFLEDASAFLNADAVVFARTFDEDMSKHLDDADVRMMSRSQIVDSVRLWDIPKQDDAIRAMRYFLAHIQKSDALLRRLNNFIDKVLADHADAYSVVEEALANVTEDQT